MILLSFAAGFLGGALHLVVAALRARAATGGSPGLAIVAGPLGVLGPAAAVYWILTVSPTHIWGVLLGLIAARLVLVAPLGRRLEEGSWTS